MYSALSNCKGGQLTNLNVFLRLQFIIAPLRPYRYCQPLRVFLLKIFVGGTRFSPHLGKSVGGGEYTPIFGGGGNTILRN